MLNIEVNRIAEGGGALFRSRIGGERLLDERARDLGGARGGTVRTAWSGAAFAVPSVNCETKIRRRVNG
jgi:hypothetical protein